MGVGNSSGGYDELLLSNPTPCHVLPPVVRDAFDSNVPRPETWSSLVERDEGCIGHSGELLCWWQAQKICSTTMATFHSCLTVGPILLLKNSMPDTTKKSFLRKILLHLFWAFILRWTKVLNRNFIFHPCSSTLNRWL